MCSPYCTHHTIWQLTSSLSAFPTRRQTPWRQCLTKSRQSAFIGFPSLPLALSPNGRKCHFLSFLSKDHIILDIKYLDKKSTKQNNNKQNYIFQLPWQIGQASEVQEEIVGRDFWENSIKEVNTAGWHMPFGPFFLFFLPAAWNLATMVAVPVAIVWAWGKLADGSKH